MSDVYPRWQEKQVKDRLRTRRVVMLVGSRQCGKTTLAKKIATKDMEYRTLDNQVDRELARTDPNHFVRHKARTLIIDEVQKVPDLLSAIKQAVDDDTRPGQYLLTGSANIQNLPSVRESLAGRVSKVRLRQLSQGEIIGKETKFFDLAFAQKFKPSKIIHDRNAIVTMALKGGFPEALAANEKDRRLWHQDYVDALIERDLQDIQHITRQDAMHKLVRILAAWSGKFIDISAIGTGLSIGRPTLYSYINALENLYVIERVSPWTRTDYDRVGKQEKLFMSDTGLMASVLKWDVNQVQNNPDRIGKVVETFAFNEIATLIDSADGAYQLFHYRDREKREIDFLVEREDEELLGIEVKFSSSIQKSDFKHLQWFRDHLAKDRRFIGMVLYTGTTVGSMGDKMWAVPLSMLWS